jgi:hypothetical protein
MYVLPMLLYLFPGQGMNIGAFATEVRTVLEIRAMSATKTLVDSTFDMPNKLWGM